MQRFKNILLVLNRDKPPQGTALRRALDLARSNGAQLKVVDVLAAQRLGLRLSPSESILRLQEQLVEDRRRELETMFEKIGRDLEVRCEVLAGKPFVEIIRYVLRTGCDLVIKEVEDEKPISSMLFGSTDLQLLRKCPCPVWMVKADEVGKGGGILAAVQLESPSGESQIDELNRTIIEIASSLARREEGTLAIVNAWIVFDGQPFAKKLSRHYLEDVEAWKEEQLHSIAASQAALQRWVENYLHANDMEGLPCTFHFVEGIAEEVIVDLAERQDMELVVMGTVARTDLAGFFVGNTSEEVLQRIDSSVLAVKPSGFASPVTPEEE